MLVYKNTKGQALILTTIFMLLILASSSALVSWSTQNSNISHYLDRKIITKEIAKAGIEKALFCLNGDATVADDCGGLYGQDYTGETNVNFGNGVFLTTITNIDLKTKQIESTGYYPDVSNPKAQTTIHTQLEINSDEVHFNFGAQVGDGGLTMGNNAGVMGNVYSNGDIVGSGGNNISYDVWSAGTSSLISNVEVGGDAHADIIDDCDIVGDAYYNTISGSTVEGTEYSPYPNPELLDFPISNEQIEEWKTEASEGGEINGNFIQTGGETVELGPKKIIGNLTLENSSTLILTGGLHVTGNISLLSGASIRLDESYGERSGFIIADGIVYIQNNGTITGADENSFIMLISLASEGGNFDSVIELKNNAEGAVLFAPNGLIYLHNGVHVTEIIGYAIHLSNTAVLEYDFGLMNTNFSSGPGGGWAMKKGTWQEIK
ncbi:MAG: hypothetical protein U9P90_00780 [Patescibacteria group bacterium]|nr:hypothetical protein [Patescibacteria group bacterium]